MPARRENCIFSNVGLGDLPDFGDAASKDVGETEGTVAAGNDNRFGKMLGVGQAWQDVKASRVAGVTYTNSTGKPIFVVITGRNTSAQGRAFVDGAPIAGFTQVSSGSILSSVSIIVPDGSTYSVASNIGVDGSDALWLELR